MKLFLTSAGLAPETTEAFLKLLDKKLEEIKVCLISTASYEKYPKGDAPYIGEGKKRLADLGFRNITDIDLRNENEKSLREKLEKLDVILMGGGNTFYLLKYVKESGFGKVLELFFNKGGIYLGISAGSMICGLNIESASWKHADRNIVKLKDLTGLKLVPFVISPHTDGSNIDAVIRSAKKADYPTVTLTDKQAILVDGKKIQFVGLGEFKQFK